MLLHSTHTYPDTTTDSGRLDFHRIDPNTLGDAIQKLNVIVDAHSALVRKDTALASALMRYENMLLDAQGGDTEALKSATSPDEFDKILDVANRKTHPSYKELELEYLAFRGDMLKFKSHYLAASHAD